MDVFITFSDVNVVQMWYSGEGDCFRCDQHASCWEKLLTEAKVRNVPLPSGAEEMAPSKIADLLFEAIKGS